MLARMQAVEIRHAIDAKQHRLAVDHERAGTVAKGGLNDQRITVGKVMAVAGKQPDALAIALHDQAIAVVLDLMNPVRAGRYLGGARRNAGFEPAVGHAKKIGSGAEISSLENPYWRLRLPAT